MFNIGTPELVILMVFTSVCSIAVLASVVLLVFAVTRKGNDRP